MRVHLVDGTFELFRCFHGAPRVRIDHHEVGATRGLLATLVSLLRHGDVTHVAVAFDSVMPPPRTPAYLTDEMLIASQAGLASDAVRALGIPVWPSGRYQADELIATGAACYAADPAVEQVVICSSDNDFDQCVRGQRVVVLDRIRAILTDEAVVRAKWGVMPEQVPDLFALVGDRSDGIAGVPGWGVKSASALIRHFGSLEAIPLDHDMWEVGVRRAATLAANLRAWHAEALLSRDLSVLRTDLPLRQSVADLEWQGADRERIAVICARLGDDSVIERITRWRSPAA